jgi:hypothetical protein
MMKNIYRLSLLVLWSLVMVWACLPPVNEGEITVPARQELYQPPASGITYPAGTNYLDLRQLKYQNHKFVLDQEIFVSDIDDYYLIIAEENLYNEDGELEIRPCTYTHPDGSVTVNGNYNDYFYVGTTACYYWRMSFNHYSVTFTSLPIVDFNSGRILLMDGYPEDFLGFDPYLGPLPENQIIPVTVSYSENLDYQAIFNQTISLGTEKTYKGIKYHSRLDCANRTGSGENSTILLFFIAYATVSGPGNPPLHSRRLILKVTFKDLVGPSIKGPAVVSMPDDWEIDMDHLLNLYTITDDSLGTITKKIEPSNNGFLITATDAVGNTSTKKIFVEGGLLYRGIINVPYIVYRTTNDRPLTQTELASNLSTYPKYKIRSIENLLSEYEPGVDGRYLLMYRVTMDNPAGAVVDVSLTVFIDFVNPLVFSVNTLNLETTAQQPLSPESIQKKLFDYCYSQFTNLEDIRITKNEYLGHEKKAGEYQIDFLIYTPGQAYSATATIAVKDLGSPLVRFIPLFITGGVFLITMAVYVIRQSTKKKKAHQSKS